MPCDYKKYPKDWTRIVSEIMIREEGRCKLCRSPNGEPHFLTGSKVILTVAHLNHDVKDNRPYNLAALCQRCHNILDMPYRVDNRRKKHG